MTIKYLWSYLCNTMCIYWLKGERWDNKFIRNSEISYISYWTFFKKCSAKHFTESWTSSNSTKTAQVIRKSKQFLFHVWHSSCYYCCKPCEKSLINDRNVNTTNRQVLLTELRLLWHCYYISCNHMLPS